MNAKTSSLASLFAVFLIGLGMTVCAHGTTLVRMKLEQIAQAADTIVRGRCLGTSSRWDNGAIWTFAEVDVAEALKGAPPLRIQVRLPGGRVGHLTTKVEDAPRLQPGEEKILFLEQNRTGDYSVTGWVEGAFRIRKNPNGEETVTQDSSDVMVFDSATRQFSAQGIRNLPMSNFRQRLAGALTQPRGGSR
ncbi:MAG TPA: hypothetical protein VGG55_05460 [Candidatus Acidoferrales bacterium]